MAQLIDLGKLRFSYSGLYNGSTEYNTNDVVKYGGNLYVYINTTADSGNLPTDTSYWSLMIEGFKFEGVYSDSTAYQIGDAVAYGGIVYLCTADTTGNEPPNVSYWVKFIDGLQWESEWDDSTEYQKSDLVRFGNNIYIANYTNTNEAPLTPVASGETEPWTLFVSGVGSAGAWDISTTYYPGSIVTYGGAAYISLDETTGEEPDSSPLAWELVVDGIQFRGEWTSATTYVTNDVVTRGGKLYISTESHAPSPAFATDLAASKWDEFGDGVRWRSSWTANTAYLTGDLVTDGVNVYIATVDFTSDATSISNDTEWETFASGADYLPGQVGNSGLFLTTDGTDPSWASPYPSQTGETGKFLTTDGSSVSWGSVDAFPTQSGNTDGLLTTDGTSVSWTQDISINTVEARQNLYVGDEALFQWENSGAKTYTITNKSKTDNIVTLTTSTNHTLGAFQFIDVALDPADADFDGEYEIIDVTANTLTYEKVGENVTSTSTGGTVSAVTGYTNSVAHFYIDADDYAQISFRNASNAVNASTDFIAYANNGDDFSGYIDMGITSENFSDPEFTITGANDGYIFMDAPVGTTGAGNLVLATGARGTENKIVFAAGGLDSDSTQMEITPDLNVHIEIPTPSTSPTTGAFTVVGGVGIQGDMNIQGDVNIVGTIAFGGEGTTVETSNLTVVDPLVFVGNQNQNDIIDLGLVGEYAKDVTDVPAVVTNKSLTSNVATLTTSLAHGFNPSDIVVVSGVDATFDGTFNVIATPNATQFTYAKVAGNVGSTVVTPTGLATKTRERRFAGVVRDASDSVIKFFHDATTKPASTVNFSESGLAYSSIKVDGIEALGTVTLPSTTAIGSVNGTEIGYLSGVSSAIQTQLDAKANNLQTTSTPSFTSKNYTLVLGDKDKFLLASNGATAGTVTIPTNAVVEFPVGTVVTVVQTGAGQLTLSSSATIRSEGNKLKLKGQYASAQLIKIATDEWVAIGNLAV